MLRFARLLPILAVAGCVLYHSAAEPTDPNVITFEQIEATGGNTILEVIAKLHAEYLRDRGRTSISSNSRDVPVVFLNQQEYGALSTLSDFAAHDIEEVRFFPWHDAVIKFGRKYGGGVIQLITRVD
jgi:glutaredoxin